MPAKMLHAYAVRQYHMIVLKSAFDLDKMTLIRRLFIELTKHAKTEGSTDAGFPKAMLSRLLQKCHELRDWMGVKTAMHDMYRRNVPITSQHMLLYMSAALRMLQQQPPGTAEGVWYDALDEILNMWQRLGGEQEESGDVGLPGAMPRGVAMVISNTDRARLLATLVTHATTMGDVTLAIDVCRVFDRRLETTVSLGLYHHILHVLLVDSVGDKSSPDTVTLKAVDSDTRALMRQQALDLLAYLAFTNDKSEVRRIKRSCHATLFSQWRVY